MIFAYDLEIIMRQIPFKGLNITNGVNRFVNGLK